MNGIELFERIKDVSSFKELLSSVKNRSKRGKMFEIVSNIIIRFGFCSVFTNDNYDHYEGNINTCKLKKVDNLKQYLKKITSSKSGSSDITLQHRTTGEYIFISCKFCNDDSNNDIKYYEVQDIHSVILKNNHKYKNYKIYLFVNNKQKVQQLIISSEETNKHLKDDISDIIGLDDLELYFQNLKQSIQDVSIDEINDKFNNKKISLELRFHQDLITYQILKKIDEGEKNLLLGAKARSGKTYCVGGLFAKYYKKYNILNSLIITPAPTETLSQFTDDLFYKFRDFIDINIIEIKKGSDFNSMTLQSNNIIIVSKQLLDDYVFDKKINPIKDLNLDSIVFDENHFHGTTNMSENIFDSYSVSKTFKLYLTATYEKPLNKWYIPENCQFYWDIEDEQLCKNRNVNGLIEKHGEDVLIFITPENKNHLLRVYDKMPDLHIITNMMDRKRYEMIKERIQDTSYGFSNGTLLSTTKDGNNFNYIEEVDNMLKYISGKGMIDEIEDPIRDKMSIFERIKYISNTRNSRTKLNNGDFTSQLWFLPFGKDMLIDKVSKCLKDRMLKNRVLSRYEIMIVNSKKDFKLKEIKEEIKNKELKAKEDGKSGLILLAGNQLTLGITLPFVDIVFLFNDVLSSDKILQMMYRCMTETINNSDTILINNGVKKIGFVVDLNISRVLNTILDYDVYRRDLNIKEKMKYLIENNLINIDSDLFENKENKSKLIEKLLHIWKSDPINNLKTLLRRIEESVIDLETKDQKLINQYFTSSINDKKVNIKVQFDEHNDEPLQSGKEIKKQDKKDKDDNDRDEDEEKDTLNISLTKDVLPFIIPLNIILTMNDKNYDLLEMIEIIKNNPVLLEVFDNQCFIWWNKKDIIKLIEKIVNKYVKKNSSIYNIAIQFKMSLQSLIDKPKELLELIDSCLKPKHSEKKMFGEVFTPPSLIYQKYEALDLNHIKLHKKSVFSEKKFKWLDNSSGMGNYSIILYLKLMEGLKKEIPNEDERKCHILENMIYMAELNKKNVFICRQIFDVNNNYCLNLYEGDALELDTDVKWGIKNFDVIIGNPPYQQKVGERKTETLWDKFVLKSLSILKENGYLVYVHPSGWRNIDGKFKNIQNEILERNLLYLEIHNEKDGLKTFNSETRYDWYILQNTNVENTNTTIKFQDKITYTCNVKGLEFIPNGNYDKIMSMIAKPNEECINIIHDYSLYETRKKWMSRIKNDEYKYPCVYTVNSKNEITYYYSSKQHGHYGIPKFIWSNGRISSIGSYVDINGDYGLTQFAYAIVDEPNNLYKIKEVFDSKEFRDLMELCAVGQLTVNYKVISIFKKDFWKEFNKKNIIDECKDKEKLIEIEVKPKKFIKKSNIVKAKRD
jgi:hypothetical protein